jgi:hypothetical protein
MGWTLNFAHPASWWMLLGLFTVPNRANAGFLQRGHGGLSDTRSRV